MPCFIHPKFTQTYLLSLDWYKGSVRLGCSCWAATSTSPISIFETHKTNTAMNYILLHDSSSARQANGNKKDQILWTGVCEIHSQTATKRRSTADRRSFPSSLSTRTLHWKSLYCRNSEKREHDEMRRKWGEKQRRRQLCTNLPHQLLWWNESPIIHYWQWMLNKLWKAHFVSAKLQETAADHFRRRGRSVPRANNLSSEQKAYFIKIIYPSKHFWCLPQPSKSLHKYAIMANGTTCM